MSPISNILGMTKHAAKTAPSAAAGQSFGSQLQPLLQQTRPNTIAAASRATTGHLHAGGMDGAAKHLLNLHNVLGA